MTAGLVRCGHCGQANRVPAAAAGTPRLARDRPCGENIRYEERRDDHSESNAQRPEIPVTRIGRYTQSKSQRPRTAAPIS
jgi:hypothetical protein